MATLYTTVKIPDPLLKSVEDFIQENPELGYRNRSEFIVEAIREKLMDLKKEGR
ncbi:MAG: ribbon-helix-helix domain-containing protein [Cuniculiplasma sp.]|jgi:metal-responsive CopG/Arc/MetJ family transcriptional regulator